MELIPIYDAVQTDDTSDKPAFEAGWSIDRKFQGSKFDEWFQVTKRGSKLSVELIAGLSNFMANSYLLVLIPEVLSYSIGVPEVPSMTGFIITTFLTSTFMGIFANIPIAMGPGVGCATFCAIKFYEVDAEYALSICFMSGALMLVLALFNLPQHIFDFCPDCVKHSMPIGLGLYLALVGLMKLEIVVPGETGFQLGDCSSGSTIIGIIGIFSIVYLEHCGSQLKYVMPIVVMTLISWASQLSPWPEAVLGDVGLSTMTLSLFDLDTEAISPILAMFVIALFDIAGIMYSCSSIAGIEAEDGIPGAYWVFVSAGAGTLLSAYMFSTPVIVLGESFAGVLAGGRTGITAITMGCLFLISWPFYPVCASVPIFASSPILVVLGAQLLALLPSTVERGLLNFEDMTQGFPAFCTIVLMPFLFDLEEGIAAGLFSWGVLQMLDLAGAGIQRLRYGARHSPLKTRSSSFSKSEKPGVYLSPYLYSPKSKSNIEELTDGRRESSSSL